MKIDKNNISVPFVKNSIFGVGVTNAKIQDVLKYVIDSTTKKEDKLCIVTPNPEILMLARRESPFRDLLNQAQIALPDGIGVLLAGIVLGKPFIERITGTDFMELLCKESSKKPISIGFFGGKRNVAKKASECLVKKYPGLQVAYAVDESEVDKLHSIPVAILFVALGAPKQEQFIMQHLQTLPVHVAMGVGGAFDFFSGEVKRAPLLVRTLGLEWLFRLIIQPWRAKRQLALIRFICLLVLMRLGLASKE